MGTTVAKERQKVVKPSTEAYGIFHQPWWLDAIAPGAWGEVTLRRGETTVARLPYARKRKFGFVVLSMPPLACRLGPWLRPSEAKSAHRMAEEEEFLHALIARLPPFDLFRQCFLPEITNWLPFYWAGFQQTTRYTYRLEDLTDLDAVWAGFHHKARGEIRKAEKILTVRTDLGIERFLELNAKIFARQGVRQSCSPELISRIDAACKQQDCRRIFFAEDAHGNTHAALYIVWDHRFVYSIVSGSDPDLRNSGAGSLLFWHAIQFAAEQGKIFDFEGSMIKPIERHFRNYGARQVPYFFVWKMNRRLKALHAGREFWQALARE